MALWREAVAATAEGVVLPPSPLPPREAPADPRIYLAAERTLLAWIRAGLALLGLGFLTWRLGFTIGDSTTSPLSLWGGLVVILLGVLVNLHSAVAYMRTVQRLNRGEPLTFSPTSPAVLVAAVLALVGIALVAYMVWSRTVR